MLGVGHDAVESGQSWMTWRMEWSAACICSSLGVTSANSMRAMKAPCLTKKKAYQGLLLYLLCASTGGGWLWADLT